MKEKLLKTALIDLGIGIFVLVFGRIYEHFSFGVTSLFMERAFLFPMLLGALPCAAFALAGRPALSPACVSFLHAAIAAFTVGSVLKGALAIYGTDSALLLVYPATGAVFFLLFCVTVLCAVRTAR